ncbi:tail protein X [Methylobacterium aquaticum]|uniref:tail protein X n=1 Tax=Methylobacterium aquaticum TaxID=270351 RepID=UPI001932013D|nr:tail protein X [Methylobacterium aquaticum]QRE76140.1 phage tail protein [Methylobacterium aquaticum]QRE77787.1 phage tail protein [Methylobacterium aquaticum]
MVYEVQTDRERIDRIAGRLYGTATGGTVEALLAANPGLAAEGAYLVRGRKIRVPAKPATTPDPALTRPWE